MDAPKRPDLPPNIQARMTEHDPRLYNVNRDVAHNFERVATMVAGRLEDELWPDLADICKREGCTMDDLGAACQAFCKFVGTSAEDPQADMQIALERCGWFGVHPAAQVAVMSCLGTVILGMHFSGVREATLAGEGPAMGLAKLASYGEQSAKLITEGRWKRRRRRILLRLRRAWSALFGAQG
jgi:hypothetical protein